MWEEQAVRSSHNQLDLCPFRNSVIKGERVTKQGGCTTANKRVIDLCASATSHGRMGDIINENVSSGVPGQLYRHL